MLRHTFQLVRGLGPIWEKNLWSQGITDWSCFDNATDPSPLSQRLHNAVRTGVGDAADHLARRDLGALASMVPTREHWRLYPGPAK